jgi:hypothetical protein
VVLLVSAEHSASFRAVERPQFSFWLRPFTFGMGTRFMNRNREPNKVGPETSAPPTSSPSG